MKPFNIYRRKVQGGRRPRGRHFAFKTAGKSWLAAGLLVAGLAALGPLGPWRHAASATTITAPTFLALQQALSSAQDGDTIEIVGGFAITAPLTLPNITLTIEGGGVAVMRAPNLTAAPLFANGSGSVTFSNITIDGADVAAAAPCLSNAAGGALTLTSVTVRNCHSGENGAAAGGGAIRSSGALVISDSTFYDNSASSAIGGAILSSGPSAALDVDYTSFMNNSSNNGGAIALANGANNVNISNSLFMNNQSSGYGGAIMTASGAIGAYQGVLTLAGDIFMDNSAAKNGGAVTVNAVAVARVEASTFSGNAALGTTSASGGGAISIDTITNLTVDAATTFSGNTAGSFQQLAPADLPIYQSLVLATQFSNGALYGWNNFDIHYINDAAPENIVQFDSMGGSAVPSQVVESGATIDRPTPDPTRAGYVFVGWYEDEALAGVYDFSRAVTSNFTLFAGWTAACPHNPALAADDENCRPPTGASVEPPTGLPATTPPTGQAGAALTPPNAGGPLSGSFGLIMSSAGGALGAVFLAAASQTWRRRSKN